MTVERIHPKAPVMLIFIAIFTCLPSCINLSNSESIIFLGEIMCYIKLDMIQRFKIQGWVSPYFSIIDNLIIFKIV